MHSAPAVLCLLMAIACHVTLVATETKLPTMESVKREYCNCRSCVRIGTVTPGILYRGGVATCRKKSHTSCFAGFTNCVDAIAKQLSLTKKTTTKGAAEGAYSVDDDSDKFMELVRRAVMGYATREGNLDKAYYTWAYWFDNFSCPYKPKAEPEEPHTDEAVADKEKGADASTL